MSEAVVMEQVGEGILEKWRSKAVKGFVCDNQPSTLNWTQ